MGWQTCWCGAMRCFRLLRGVLYRVPSCGVSISICRFQSPHDTARPFPVPQHDSDARLAALRCAADKTPAPV